MCRIRSLLLVTTIIFVCLGCQSQQEPSAGPEQSSFRTTQPSLLFFKNMRSSYYRSSEDPESRIAIYRLNRWQGLSDREQVWKVAIASDWLNDRAFLVPEWKAEQPERLSYTDGNGTEQVITLPGPAPNLQTQWILALAHLLDEGAEVRAHFPNGSSRALLPSEASKDCFQTVIKDYLRLTEQS